MNELFITVEKIKLGIYIWGFYPALLMLKDQEILENYENCAIIKQAMDSVYGVDFDSSTRQSNINHVFDAISSKFDHPNMYKDNLDIYIEGFKREIQNK